MRSQFVLFAASCLFSAAAYAGGIVNLHGKIVRPISDSILVTWSESRVGYEPRSAGAKLNSDGTFSLSFPLKNDYTVVMIRHGEQGTEIAPCPGDDLSLTLDAANFDSTLRYTGKGADVANFMAAHMLARSFVNVFSSRLQGACAFGPDSFIARSHTSLQKEMDFLKNNGASLPESFRKFWGAYFQYGLYNGTLNYPLFHEVQQQHSYTISKFDTADFRPVRGVPALFDDALLTNPEYCRYITRYYNEQLSAKETMDGRVPTNIEGAVLELVVANMPPGSAELYEASLVYQGMKNNTYKEQATKLSAFKKRYPKSEYLQLLNDKMAFKKKVSAGSEALDFTVHTTDGKTMKFSDLKGKVVFLDFWASWCGPCMGEMPHAKKIEEQYKGKDVVFLYVSIDDDDANWKKALEKIQVDGVHMRDSGGWKGQVATEYGIQSVPAYFLIDKNGQYALDAAPRPSQETELVAAIDKLLK